ncbi:hypothetical protein GCM10009663_14550 [Kitasatospora arboriphila]|uniref:Secreted protein n=1 Tax=Kitasatospora arboriphila TaxID=258052 RepID=A0ABN1TCM3_9ACTN
MAPAAVTVVTVVVAAAAVGAAASVGIGVMPSSVVHRCFPAVARWSRLVSLASQPPRALVRAVCGGRNLRAAAAKQRGSTVGA